MSNRVITISREFGSGGRTIGKLVAEKLGIPCYDAELIEKIAQQTGYTSDYVRSDGEREETPEIRIKEKDKRRATYHRFYTDMKCGMHRIMVFAWIAEPLELRNVLQSFLSYSNQHALIEIYTSLS